MKSTACLVRKIDNKLGSLFRTRSSNNENSMKSILFIEDTLLIGFQFGVSISFFFFHGAHTLVERGAGMPECFLDDR